MGGFLELDPCILPDGGRGRLDFLIADSGPFRYFAKMKYFLPLAVSLGIASCAEFPGTLRLTTNPDGTISAGVTIETSESAK